MPTALDFYKTESKYFKAEDLEQPRKVTIKTCAPGTFKTDDGRDQTKLVLTFADSSKQLVVNRTNALEISTLHGEDFTTWPGKQIVLFRTKVAFGAKVVDAVRVRAPHRGDPEDQPQKDSIPF